MINRIKKLYLFIIAFLSASRKNQGVISVIGPASGFSYLFTLIFSSVFFRVLNWNRPIYFGGFILIIFLGIFSYWFAGVLININLKNYEQIEIYRKKIPNSISIIFVLLLSIATTTFFCLSLPYIFGPINLNN